MAVGAAAAAAAERIVAEGVGVSDVAQRGGAGGRARGEFRRDAHGHPGKEKIGEGMTLKTT